jgi:predicted ABC-type ATPase
MNELLSRHPIVVALAGPNGAGKSSFYRIYLEKSRLPFINADVIALRMGVDAYKAAELAEEIRQSLFAQRDSFIFETVFSDPVGAKLQFLKQAQSEGYTVLLAFIGVDSAETSELRVEMRVSKGGHDVPHDKIFARYGRTMRNLQQSLLELDNVRVYDNTDTDRPYRLAASRDVGHEVVAYDPTPAWLKPLMPRK